MEWPLLLDLPDERRRTWAEMMQIPTQRTELSSTEEKLLKQLEDTDTHPKLRDVPDWVENYQSLPFALHQILLKGLKPKWIKRRLPWGFNLSDERPRTWKPTPPGMTIPPEVIREFVEAWPDAVKLKYKDMTLLHIACVKGAPVEIVQLITEKYPEALTETFAKYGINMGNPLEILLRKLSDTTEPPKTKHTFSVVEYFCENWPIMACTRVDRDDEDSVTKEDRGLQILHSHCSYDYQPIYAIEPLIRQRPELLTTKHNGLTILHRACRKGLHLSYIREMLEKYPQLAEIPASDNYEGLLPLHFCLGSFPGRLEHNPTLYSPWTLGTIQLLTALSPDAIKVKTKEGNLPLDLLKSLYGDNEDTLQEFLPYLVDNPQQPIHFYFRVGGDSTVTLRWLIDKYPESLSTPDPDGNLPLHLAIQAKLASPAVQRLLLISFPGACSVPNAEGYLPLHLAMQASFPTWQSLASIVDAFPVGVGRKDPKGWLPFLLAAQNDLGFQEVAEDEHIDVSLTLTFYLLQKDPGLLRYKNV